MDDKLRLIGQRIRDERNRQKWLISELSKRTGLSIPHISSIERGKCNFSIESLVSVSNALGVDVNYLLFGSGYTNDAVQDSLQSIISDCNRKEIKILIENARYLKETLRKNSI